MEEPVHYLMLLLLQFNGTVVKEILEFSRPLTLLECMNFGDAYREIISTYKDFGLTDQGWYLNDGSGTYQGSICLQDPDRIK